MKPWNKNRTNSLLLKDSVGAAKQSIYTIPSDIYFGKAIVHDKEGAQESIYIINLSNLKLVLS